MSYHILIIEDSAADFELAGRQLKTRWPAVHCRRVDTLDDLRRALDAAGWDVVLIDYHVPGLDFENCLRLLRARLPRSPVILLSGAVGEEKAVELLKLGFAGFVLKENLARLPFVLERSLREAVETGERERLEKALRDRERQLSVIVDNISDAVFFLAVEPGDRFRFVSVNAAFLSSTGLAEGQVKGAPVEEVFPASAGSLVLANCREVVRTKKTARWEAVSEFPAGKRFGEAALTPVFEADGVCSGLIGVVHDTTERKRAEDELRKLSGVVQTSPDFIGIASVEGRCEFINAAGRKLVGLDELEPVNVLTIMDLVHESEGDHLQHDFWPTLSRDGNWDGEGLYRNFKTGAAIPVWRRVFFITEPGSNRRLSIAAISRDITERKRMETELKLFHTLSERSNDAVYILDFSTGRFLDVNESGCRDLGYTRDELLALTVFDIAVGLDHSLYAAVNSEIESTGHARRELLHRRKDGTTFPVEVSLSRAELDGKFLLAIARDITERKKAEESRALLATAVAQAAESIMITDTDGNIRYVNPALEKVSGYAAAELLGRNPRILKSGLHDAGFYRRIWEALERGEVWRGHLVNRSKNGKLYEEEATFSPVRDTSGKVVHYVAVKRDVTRETQLESQLRHSQKLEGIGQLAGGVAHDFNNIIAVIMMQAQLSCMADDMPEELRKGLQTINAAAERAANLTRQLLLFSRKQVMQVRPVDLNEAVTGIAKMLQRVIREDVRLQLRLHPAPLMALADPGMLDQVLMNLAVNARDAMPKGGGLVIETAAKVVDTEGAAQNPEASPGRFVSLSVRDTGCGIPPEIQSRLFEPFFTTKEPGKGTGLGLATVFGIVKQHKGWIEVESEVGKGANFRVFLPALAAPAEDGTAGKKAKPQPRGGSETILFAEDNDGIREVTRILLERFGYKVLEAADGVEAQRVWAEHQNQISLLLTDLVMPGRVNGCELAALLQKQRPHLKVILTSGYSTDIGGLALKLPAGQIFIQKPCPPDQLLETIRKCLDS